MRLRPYNISQDNVKDSSLEYFTNNASEFKTLPQLTKNDNDIQ